MALTRIVDGVEVILTAQEEADLVTEWAVNQAEHDAKEVLRVALNNQIENEKTDLPTWTQVATAIDNAFTDNAQANIIKKIARPVYTYLKKTVS